MIRWWYETQLRLKVLAGDTDVHGISINDVAQKAFDSFGPQELGLSCSALRLPCSEVCEALQTSADFAVQKHAPYKFDKFVEERDMGSDDLDYSLAEVLLNMYALCSVFELR